MVPACVLADGALDVGRPLLVSYNSSRSNGRQQSLDPAYARRFIEDIDPAILDALPIPGLYTSQHNVVGYDLASAAARCPRGSTPSLDLVNLVHRAREDLAQVVWTDEQVRREQYGILEVAEASLGVAAEPAPRPPVLASLVQRAAGFASSLVRRPATFASPLEAARAADRHYAAGGV
jgi:hypothetical protein